MNGNLKIKDYINNMKSSKKQKYYDANGNEITDAYMVDSDGNHIPFEFTNAAKNGYKNAIEYMATHIVKDPINREDSELHMRMAKAAVDEVKKTFIDANGSSTCH